MSLMAKYDEIGSGYNYRRQVDGRVLHALIEQLQVETGAKILDVGAGTGNYVTAMGELGYHLWAVEPSQLMSAQRVVHENVQWVNGVAENIPFQDEQFDAVYCTLAMHHFPDQMKAYCEMFRVLKRNGRFVALTADPRRVSPDFWMRDYFAELFTADEKIFPAADQLKQQLAVAGFGHVQIRPFLIPYDVKDGFFCSAWRRPEDYLDANFRQGMSPFRLMDQANLQRAVLRLADDLQSGAWDEKYGSMRKLTAYDAGYLFVSAQKH